MKIIKFFLCLIFCFASFFCMAEECKGVQENELNEYAVIENKIYVNPNQIYISNEGIFIFVEGEKILVRQLNCDEKGIYCLIEHLDKITDKCYNGHQIWCKRCWGCVVRYCKFRCSCVTWE